MARYNTKTKINHSQTRRRATVLFIVLIVAAGTIVVLELTNVTHLFHSNVAEQKREAAQRDLSRKKALTEQGSPSKSEKENALPDTNYKTPDNTDNIQLSAERAGASVTVYSRLYGYSDGTCSLKITNGTATETKTAAVLYRPQYAICEGFSIPVDGLGAGTWSLALTVSSDGVSLTKTISLEVT